MFVVKKNQFLDVEKTWICVGQFFWGGECYLVLACLSPGYYEQAKKIDGRAQHEIRMEKGWASRCWRFLPVVSFRLFYFCYPPQDGNVNVRRPFVFRPMDPTPARKRRGGSKMPTSTVSTTAILKRNSKVIPAERESSLIFFDRLRSNRARSKHNTITQQSHRRFCAVSRCCMPTGSPLRGESKQASERLTRPQRHATHSTPSKFVAAPSAAWCHARNWTDPFVGNGFIGPRKETHRVEIKKSKAKSFFCLLADTNKWHSMKATRLSP